MNRTDELKEEDIGTKCGLFEVKKIGDEYFCFLSECEDPKACTIVLRGASRDILKEVGTHSHSCALTQLNQSESFLCDKCMILHFDVTPCSSKMLQPTNVHI